MEVRDTDEGKPEAIREKILKAPNGLGILILDIILTILCIPGFIWSVVQVSEGNLGYIALLVVCGVYFLFFSWIILMGVKVLRPNEAMVLTLFGSYYGTLVGEGIFFVNPFCTNVNPAAETAFQGTLEKMEQAGGKRTAEKNVTVSKKLS